MKKFISLIILLSFVCACAPKTLPPELKPAYTANEVLVRVSELQTTVIDLYDARGITKDKADLIVKFTVSSATIIKASMTSWQATVKQSWLELKKQYQPTDPKLQVVWNLVDVMMGVL